jgi:single-strand DNA-binding protein
MGRLTRDPELRRTGSGMAVASFSVAVDRDYPNKDTGEKETDFINCVAWRQRGEFVSKYFTKGSMIIVSGRLQIRSWTDDNGTKRTTAEIVAEDVYFGESKKKESSEGVSAPSYIPNLPYYTPPTSNIGDYVTPTNSDFAMFDDDSAVLPF